MKIVDIRLVNDYIHGKDLPCVEELEKDIDFMKCVLHKSKDKKMFNFCSEELKMNANFIVYVINLFRFDKEFVVSVVDDYLKGYTELKDNEEKDYSELDNIKVLAHACHIICDEEDTDYKRFLTELKYGIGIEQIYIALELAKLDNDYLTNSIQEGFVILQGIYEDEVVINYIARIIIDNIFDEIGPIRQYLDKHFGSIKTVKEYGIKKLIIDIINSYDTNLGSYVMNNIGLIEKKAREIESIVNDWEEYEENIKRTKYEIIYEYVHNYLVEYKLESLEREILHLIGIELNITEDVEKYLLGRDVFITDDGEEIDTEREYLISDKSELDFYTLRHYEEIKNYIYSILFDNKIDDNNNTDKKCKKYKIKRGN